MSDAEWLALPHREGQPHVKVGIFPPVTEEAGQSLCQCADCFDARWEGKEPYFAFKSRMILCAICGNKRCPHAKNHANACTDSNKPGQVGSAWEAS